MKIVFMGTPDFAVPSLEALIEKYGVEAVFTQPDRPKGRGKKILEILVKFTVQRHRLTKRLIHNQRIIECFASPHTSPPCY